MAHFSLNKANGVAKIINLSTNVAALAVFLFNRSALLPLGLTAGAFSIAGSYLGTLCFEKGGAKVVKPVMVAVILLFFIKIISEQGWFS